MPRTLCGRCYYDRGQKVDLAMLKNKESKKITLICLFCDQERHPGAFRTRVHINPDMGSGQDKETVLNIPHVVVE